MRAIPLRSRVRIRIAPGSLHNSPAGGGEIKRLAGSLAVAVPKKPQTVMRAQTILNCLWLFYRLCSYLLCSITHPSRHPRECAGEGKAIAPAIATGLPGRDAAAGAGAAGSGWGVDITATRVDAGNPECFWHDSLCLGRRCSPCGFPARLDARTFAFSHKG